MCVETAIIAAAVIGAAASGGIAAASGAFNKPKGPTLPKTPIAPTMPAGDRQKRRAAGAYGRGDTILTSPLGVPGNAALGSAKSLLGQ